MKKRRSLPLPSEHQTVNGDFSKIQTENGNYCSPNPKWNREKCQLLISSSYIPSDSIEKRFNVLLRNRILSSFLHNNQPAASDLLPRSNTPHNPSPKTPTAQLATINNRQLTRYHYFNVFRLTSDYIYYHHIPATFIILRVTHRVMTYVFRRLCWHLRQCQLC